MTGPGGTADARTSFAVTYLTAGLAVVSRDMQLFFSYRFRWISQLLQVILSLTLFFYISRLLQTGAPGAADDYYAFAVVGIVVLQVLTATMGLMPLALRQELVAGTFERLVVSPFGALGSVASMTVFPFLSNLAIGTGAIAFAAAVFGLPLEWSTAALSLPVAALAGLNFAPFGILLASAVIAVKQAGAGTTYVITFFSLVGGFFFPVALLPGSIQWLSEVQPFTPTLDLLRHVLVGAPLREAAMLSVMKLAIFPLVLLPLSAYVLGSAMRLTRRRGTIAEY